MVNEAVARLAADLEAGEGGGGVVDALAERLSAAEWAWDAGAALFSPMALP